MPLNHIKAINAETEKIKAPTVGMALEYLLNQDKLNTSVLSSIQRDFEKNSQVLDRILAAFPNQDTDGHCRYHVAIIEDVEARKKLTQAIKEKTISGLIWSMMVATGAAFWHEILRVIGKTP